MRIAFFHELPEGGARIVATEIANYLGKNHTLDLYYTDTKPSKNESVRFKKKYFYKFVPRKWKGNDFKTRIYKDTVELFKLRTLHAKIASDIDAKNYDVILVHPSRYIQSPFILSFLKTTTAFYLHDPHFRIVYDEFIKDVIAKGVRGTYEKLHKSLLKKIDRDNLLNADYLIANSKYTQKRTLATYGRKSTVVYLGIDTHFFKPANIINKSIDVLYIGSRDILDGYDILSNAVGDVTGVVRNVFREKEWITQEKIRDLYRESKVVLCFGRNEPFGLIPLEAAACGVPVIAIDEGGYQETVIDGKTGFLVRNHAKEIKSRIQLFIANDAKSKKMAEEARKNAVKNWDWNIRIREFENILSRMAQNEKS